MTTRRLYYDDSFQKEFTAEVLSCDPIQPPESLGITAPVWSVVLDRTAFYPTSGGQPHDLGKLSEATVLEVHEDQGEIVHVVDTCVQKAKALGCINWPRRFDHMQQHTGQHLLSAMFQERFGLPTVSFHLGAEICSIDLHGPEPSPDILEGAERAANQIIFDDRSINIRYATAEQLAEIGVRKKVDREGMLRAIEIEGADLQPCGGTHVRSTGQIGVILVRRCSKIRQDWRVEFVCGSRAARIARQDFMLLRRAAEKLSCANEEIPAAAERAITERDTHYKASRASLLRLAQADAQLILQASPAGANGLRIISQVFQEVQLEYLTALAVELAKSEKTIALLARSECGHIFFAQHSSANKNMSDLLKQVLSEFGGKGGGPADFARGRLDNPAEAGKALAAAQKILSST